MLSNSYVILREVKTNISPYNLLRFLFAALLFLSFTHSDSGKNLLFHYGDSEAYKHYASGPRNELAKLICVLDFFKNRKLKIVVDGHEYEAYSTLKGSKSDLMAGYRNEKADYFIREYFYRSDAGDIMYLKFSNGELLPLRDFLLDQIAKIEELSKRSK